MVHWGVTLLAFVLGVGLGAFVVAMCTAVSRADEKAVIFTGYQPKPAERREGVNPPRGGSNVE